MEKMFYPFDLSKVSNRRPTWESKPFWLLPSQGPTILLEPPEHVPVGKIDGFPWWIEPPNSQPGIALDVQTKSTKQDTHAPEPAPGGR